MTQVYSETRRKTLHIGMVGFAMLLRVLTWPQAALCAVMAFLFNVLVLPRLGGATLNRPADRARGYPLGIVLYPVAVLALVLVFRTRLDLAAAAWAIMGIGDGSATLAGMAGRRHRLPWNGSKSVEGLVAFVVAGGIGAVALAWWTAPSVTAHPDAMFLVAAPLIAALAAGLAETVPITLDDNMTVPAVSGAVLWLLTLVSEDAWIAARPLVMAQLPMALVVNSAAAFGGWKLGTVRASGMLAGWAIGVAVYAGAGPAGWTLLFVTFLSAAVTSRLGLRRKALLGIAEERGGRRGGGNAFANTGLAAVAALAAVFTPYRDASLLALVAALVTGGSDTVASEIGKAWGGRTYLVTTFSQVKPGTPGAMSAEGTIAGLVGAIGLAAAGAGFTTGAVLLRWQRAADDFRSAAELRPACWRRACSRRAACTLLRACSVLLFLEQLTAIINI